MRKQIIKFFSLDYKVFIFGRLVSFTRSANVIFPFFLLLPLIPPFGEEIAPLLWGGVGVGLALALFFGFVYFRIKPLKQADYDYFDEVQRFSWDFHHNKNPKEPKKYNSVWVALVNPLAIVLFLLWYFFNN